jgi:enamine deaminase RidA (YjgF/YER057c/UK114 family)
MARRLISAGSPFEHQGGYSRAVVDGDFCFVAGTTGYDDATMKMPTGVADQARNTFRTIAAVLGEAGFALANIVRGYILHCRSVRRRRGPRRMRRIFGRHQTSLHNLVVAGLLRPEMKVEIEVTAKRRGSKSEFDRS